MSSSVKVLAVLLLALAPLPACVVVPAYDREYLSERSMGDEVDPLEARARRQFYMAREAASGGDGESAGGGCGCAN